MKNKISLLILTCIFFLTPTFVNAAISADISNFNYQYNAMLNNTSINKTLTCSVETAESDMNKNGIFQYAKSGSVTANAGSELVETVAENDPMCQSDYYTDNPEYEDFGKVMQNREVTANYYITQSGILNINMDRGPIHSGGKFKFDMSYINTVRYYVEDNMTTECNYSNESSGKVSVDILKPKIEEVCNEEGICHDEYIRKTVCDDSIPYYKRDDLDNCPNVSKQDIVYECELETVEVRKPDCEQLESDEAKADAEAAAKDLVGNLGSNAVVKVPSGSNKLTSPQNMDGEWKCSNPVQRIVLEGGKYVERPSAGDYLGAKTEWISRCEYKLDARLDLNSANVFYNNSTTDSGVFKEIGNSYYIPLKYPSSDIENDEYYTVTAELTELSGMKNVNWSANYSCDIEVKQIMYDLEEGGFLFVYRPILITMPFPNTLEERKPSKNWITWWEDSSNQQKLAASYSNLEYAIDLSPTDIRNIKTYNEDIEKNSGKRLGYLDYSINKNGTSNFSYVQPGRQTTDYNELGEFEGEDS